MWIPYAVEFFTELWRVHDRKSMAQTVGFSQNFVVFWKFSWTKQQHKNPDKLQHTCTTVKCKRCTLGQQISNPLLRQNLTLQHRNS